MKLLMCCDSQDVRNLSGFCLTPREGHILKLYFIISTLFSPQYSENVGETVSKMERFQGKCHEYLCESTRRQGLGRCHPGV